MEYEGKTFADYVAILRRRLTVVLVSFMIVWLPGMYVAYSIPATYRSTATILIEQQNISQDFVQTGMNTYADEQIAQVRQRVMRTAILTEIVERYDLYPELTATQPIQVAVDELRANALLENQSAEVVNQNTGRTMFTTIAFSLSFDYSDPALAQSVASDLAELYLRENVENRSGQVQDTISFLEADIQRTRRDLDSASEALTVFKELNEGNLPELLNFHLQTVERTEQQLDGLDRDIREARNRRLALETELARLPPMASAYDEFGEPILGTGERLALLQNERLRLLSIYSPQHPDVVQIEREIELLNQGAAVSEAQIVDLTARLTGARLQLQEASERYSPEHPDVLRHSRSVASLERELEAVLGQQGQPGTMAQSPVDPIAHQLRLRVESEDSFIQSLLIRRSELQAKLSDLDNKISNLPRIEQEYEALLRDAELASQHYDEALAALGDARRTEMLEQEGAGERFAIIDSPQYPTEPYSPNRVALVMLSIVLALGVGVVLATLIDTLDTTIKNARDVGFLIDTPPLAVIPYLENSHEVRIRYGKNALVGAMIGGGLTLGVLIAILSG